MGSEKRSATRSDWRNTADATSLESDVNSPMKVVAAVENAAPFSD
jgi:hypothetical protein